MRNLIFKLGAVLVAPVALGVGPTAAVATPAPIPTMVAPSLSLLATNDHRCVIKQVGESDKILLQKEESGGHWINTGAWWNYSSVNQEQCEEDCLVAAQATNDECQETVDLRN